MLARSECRPFRAFLYLVFYRGFRSPPPAGGSLHPRQRAAGPSGLRLGVSAVRRLFSGSASLLVRCGAKKKSAGFRRFAARQPGRGTVETLGKRAPSVSGWVPWSCNATRITVALACASGSARQPGRGTVETFGKRAPSVSGWVPWSCNATGITVALACASGSFSWASAERRDACATTCRECGGRDWSRRWGGGLWCGRAIVVACRGHLLCCRAGWRLRGLLVR